MTLLSLMYEFNWISKYSNATYF